MLISEYLKAIAEKLNAELTDDRLLTSQLECLCKCQCGEVGFPNKSIITYLQTLEEHFGVTPKDNLLTSHLECIAAAYGVTEVPDRLTTTYLQAILDNISGTQYGEFTVSGYPLTLTGCVGEPLVDYNVSGNALQDNTPSADNPVEVQACGDKTANLIRIEPFSVTFGWGSSVIRDFLNALDIGTYTISYNTKLLTRNDISDSSIYGIRLINEAGSIEHTYSWGAVNAGTVSKIRVKVTITEQNKGKFTNAYFYGCGVWGVGVTGNAQIYDFMLNAGETALPYEPYGYKIPFTTAAEDGSESITTTVYLDKPLYKIGDYADSLSYAEQKADRVIKELVLTGEEYGAWNYNITIRNGNGFYNPTIFTGYKPNAGVGYCTHYPLATATTDTIGVLFGGNINFITDFAEGIDTADKWKSYLATQYAAGTPVKVWYVLQTPESESVEIPEIPTLNGTTIIEADTTVQPSNMDVTYIGQNPTVKLMMMQKRGDVIAEDIGNQTLD